MKYHKQKQLYVDGDKKQRGSCLQTAYACLLDLEIDEVPPFHLFYWSDEEVNNIRKVAVHNKRDPNKESGKSSMLWSEAVEYFLASYGYAESWFDADEAEEWFKENPEVYVMASGPSPRDPANLTHVCIYQNGKMVHDPHPSNDDIVSVNSYRFLTKV